MPQGVINPIQESGRSGWKKERRNADGVHGMGLRTVAKHRGQDVPCICL